MADDAFIIGDVRVERGQRVSTDLRVGEQFNHSPVTMPVHVIHSKKPGPVLFVSAAVHGDEINGVEIIRRLLKLPRLKQLRGTLIAAPIVNVLGFLNQSRYLPDRRDLNRSFPGSERGSMAGRLAELFCREIINQADFGIDLHTAAIHRSNLPQIRANLDDATTLAMAEAFGVPVMIHSPLRDGSMREYAVSQGTPILVYEAGEALRFDEVSIRAGLRGVQRVMQHLGMLPKRKTVVRVRPEVANSSSWSRAPCAGIANNCVELGERVSKGQVLTTIGDPLGDQTQVLTAPTAGLIIGQSIIPLVHEGDALFHIARFDRSKSVAGQVESFHQTISESDNPNWAPPGEPDYGT